jgi:dolichyl-phosphate beta-glucosyltransferase
MSRTILVIPCYNEAERLDAARFCEFVASSPDVELLFVNDGSTDGTLRVLRDMERNDPERIGVFDLPRNVGKAEAVRQGMLAALRRGPDYAGYWDADLATPLEAVEKMRNVLDRRPAARLVLGSRVKLLGRRIARRPLRHLLGRCFATSASWVLRLGVYDTQCGAKLFRACPTTAGVFQQPFLSRWIFDVELLARLLQDPALASLSAAHEALYELPLDQWRDVAGSKLKARHMLRAALELAVIYRNYGRPQFAPDASAYSSDRRLLEDTLPELSPIPRVAMVPEEDEERRAA